MLLLPHALLLLFALGSASSSKEESVGGGGDGSGPTSPWSSGAESGGLVSGGSGPSSPESTSRPAEAFFLAPDPDSTKPPDASSTLASNRIPFQLDFTTPYRRFARSSEASNVTNISVSTLPSTVVNITRRYRRDDQNPCSKFEEGDPRKREFYSPNHPNPYPKNMSCFKVLEAEPGKVLKVEFRDGFDLEDNNKCEFDYLEVRDGKYGYSRPIGKYCRPFPFPEITSSSRHLWLHFRSDSSIQGEGFRAVWSEIPRPSVKTPEPEECILNITNVPEYVIKTAEIEDRKKIALEQGTELECIWNITVNEGYKIQITFPQFHLDKPNECDINYVQFYDKDLTSINNPTLISNFCGSIADLVTSKGNEAYLRFFVTRAAMNSSFEATVTAIREKEGKDKGCNDDEFDCQDACIANDLRCNGRPNCRYRFDEDADVCNVEKTGLNMGSEHVIIVLIVFTLLMSGLCFTCIFNCIKKLIRDHKIIKEHIRQSREKRLDELGRKSTPCSMVEPCTEMGGMEHHHHHRLHRQRSSESPSLEVLANPRELISPATLIGRDYSRERSVVRLSVDLSDIHQSNNVSNATQERLQVSVEEPDTRDMACQTTESFFNTIKSSPAHPFTTFGYQTPDSRRKHSVGEYQPSQHYQHHAHPHHHPQAFAYHHHHHHMHRQVSESSPPPPPPPPPQQQAGDKPEPSPVGSRRCSRCWPSVEASPGRLCPRHSLTPIVPAPPGWSAHESMYGPDELAQLAELAEPSPGRLGPMARQRTVGSGENYGFLYGPGDKDGTPSELTQPSSVASSQRSQGAKPVKCPQVAADSRFKTEAVIEIDQKRPFSIDSTKSAPDVIATH